MSKILEKHKKYKDTYGSNEIFWGLGIELETYFQFEKPIQVAAPILRKCHKAERYSVDYYKSYKALHEKVFQMMFPDSSGCFPLPFLINGHCLSKMDRHGNHITTYEKNPKPNPKFAGKTLLEEMKERSDLFKNDHEIHYVFDGDTVEFMTLDFYKSKATKVIKELVDYKIKFLNELNLFIKKEGLHKEKGTLLYPPYNPGFAVFYSNPGNVVMFNNGTYHINITLPSLLGSPTEDGSPTLAFPDLFRQQHKVCIKMIQWFEPFLLAVYGTPDPLSFTSPIFSKGSQRCAVSRYIGIGTYDVEKMPEGKIMTLPLKEIAGSQTDFWWYNIYHQISGYIALEQIGMDINYKKHYNHGIELRFFDWFPEGKLYKLITELVYICEVALDRDETGTAALSKTWNLFVIGVLKEGGKFKLTDEIAAIYERILGVALLGTRRTVTEAFEYIFKELKRKYKGGECVKRLL